MCKSLGKSAMDMSDGKSGIIMVDLDVNFKAEAFMFEELIVEIHIRFLVYSEAIVTFLPGPIWKDVLSHFTKSFSGK
jgi:hypothetical protein